MNPWRAYLIGFYTIVNFEVRRFTRLWMQTLLPPIITMSLYLIIFGTFIGQRLPSVEHVPFMQYMAPGLIMMAIITNAYANVSSSFYLFRFQRSIEEILVSPLPSILILLGFCTGGIFRGIIVGLLVALVSLFFTHLHFSHPIFTFTVVVLTSALFSLTGFLNALLARNFDDISIIPTFVLTPLTYLGGVFFSVSQLQGFWKIISDFNPVFYIVSAFRYGILDVQDVNVYLALWAILLSVALFGGLNIYLLNRGIGLRT